MKIKTIEQAEELGLDTHSYLHGDWGYQDKDGYLHLFRDGEELLPEIKKKFTTSYSNGDWVYQDIKGYYHVFRGRKELLPNVKKKNVFSYSNDVWEYKDTEEKWHIIKENNHGEQEAEIKLDLLEKAFGELASYTEELINIFQKPEEEEEIKETLEEITQVKFEEDGYDINWTKTLEKTKSKPYLTRQKLGIEEIKPGVYKIKSVVILNTTNQR